MAIYRTGKASMAANGVITGTGTAWQTSLALIRAGATIMFFTGSAVSLATISDIVSDTELRATNTDGNAVASTDYVILLHDSLTVDGLAQDIAEALKYYQGQESNLAGVIDFLNRLDMDQLEQWVADIKAAEVSTAADKAAVTQMKADVATDKADITQLKADTQTIKTETDQIKTDTTAIKGEAVQAKSDAVQAKTDAEAAVASIGDIQDAIDSITNAIGMPIGFVHYWADRASIPNGRVALDGQILPYATYPDVKAAIQGNKVPVCPDADWLSTPAKRYCFTQVDADHFRMPDYNGAVSGSIPQITLTGGSDAQKGIKGGEIPNIKGSVGITNNASYPPSPPFKVSTTIGAGLQVAGGTPWGANQADFDFSTANSVFKDSATDIHASRAVGVMVCVIFGGVTNPGSVDGATLATRIEQVNTDMLSRVNNSFIRGLNVAVTAGTGIVIGAGAFSLPSGIVYGTSTDTTIAIPATTASTWYHLYAYNSGGNAAFEVSTTSPTAYAYPAHQKTGDVTRRYIGSFRTSSSNVVFKQTLQNGQCIYQSSWDDNGRVLAGGVSTDFVVVSLVGRVPSTAFEFRAAVPNTSGSGAAVIYPQNSNDSYTFSISPNSKPVADFAIQSYPNIYYKYISQPSGGSGLYIDVGGYKYAR